MANPESFNSEIKPGLIVLFGSGETSPSGRKAFDLVMKSLKHAPNLALLETPAGFELNSHQVIQRVADFIELRLQNYRPHISIVPARKKGTDFSPDSAEILEPMLGADLIFMGPGSPSYAINNLKNSLAWQYLVARHFLGSALVFASAAAIAISRYSLPVYEIYKVGEDLHWKDGLGLFGLYDLPLVFVPHWNNNDGGEELDTSRCFMGRERFARLVDLLPPDLTIIGIDEKTALVMDLSQKVCRVVGMGGVTLIHTGHDHSRSNLKNIGEDLLDVAEQYDSHLHAFNHGETFPLNECCPLEVPMAGLGVSESVWEKVIAGTKQHEMDTDQPPEAVLALLNERQAARDRKDWLAADQIRKQVLEYGWQIQDTPEGVVVKRFDDD